MYRTFSGVGESPQGDLVSCVAREFIRRVGEPVDFMCKAARYIKRQEAHHAQLSFQDEMRNFFRCNQLPYDERYVWD